MNRTGHRVSSRFIAVIAPLAIALALGACDDFVLRTLMEGEDGSAWAGPLRISPATATVLQNSTTTFAASGGGGGYSYSLVTGLGGAINGASGAYTAPAISGTEVVRVTDKVGGTSDAAVTITGGSPDYHVLSANFPGPGAGNTAFGGDFVVENASSDAGISDVTWSLYRSSDATVGPGDRLVDTGTAVVGGLGAFATSGPIPFGGTWPSTGGSWYLIIEVHADDDSTSANNRLASGSIPVSPAPPADVDYTVLTVNNVGGTTASAPLAGTFTFRNNGTDNGAETVYWTAYVSTDAVLDGGDPVVDADVWIPLTSGGTSPPIPFNGTWPSTPTSYYLIVKVSASDDVNGGNDSTPSVAIPVTSPQVDYTVMSVNNTGGTSAAGPITATFTYRNLGTANGSQTVHWTAYVSTDVVIDGGDTIIDADVAPPLNSLVTSGPVGFTGTWPATPGTYYLLISVSAPDDVNGGNNSGASGPVITTSPPAPDYQVTFGAGLPWSDLLGTGINGTPDFTIQNISANPGAAQIYWYVYRSLDKVLDGGDTLINQGNITALGGLGSDVVPFAGAWPASPAGLWYLIVRITAVDDVTPVNNGATSHPIGVAHAQYVEGVENNGDSGPTPPPFVNVSLTGITLALNQTMVLEGVMDVFNAYDTYRFQAGASVNGVSMQAAWQTGFDDIDIYFWNDGGAEVSSIGVAIDGEPGGGSTLDITGLTPFSNYYASANFWLDGGGSGSTGQKYVMLVRGNP